MATLTYDTKSSTTLTKDTRSSAGTFTNDSKPTFAKLWDSTIFPWAEQSPWLLDGSGYLLVKDLRN